MGLLDDVIKGAAGDEKITRLLRSLEVIASRGGLLALGDWVSHELAGYPPDAVLPEYRGPFDAVVLGIFSGPFGSGLKNALIPSANFPEFMRDQLFTLSYPHPVVELEQFARAGDDLRVVWDANEVAITNTLIRQGEITLYPGMGLMEAWRVLTQAQLAGVIDGVRSRVLKLALEMERIAPEAGEKGATFPPAAASMIVNILNSSGTNVALGNVGPSVTQSAELGVTPGDWTSLMQALVELGVPGGELNALRDAIAEDGGVEGDRTRSWVGRMMLHGRDPRLPQQANSSPLRWVTTSSASDGSALTRTSSA